MVTLFHHRPPCYPLPMEQGSNGSGNGISDVEFLEFLVGYSNSNNGGGGNNNNSQNHHHSSSNGNHPHFSTQQDHFEASSTSPAHSNRENNEDLHQPWRSPHQQDFTDHIQQQQEQPKQPIHIQIPSTPSSPSAAAAEEQEDPRRRSGMVERWEPGEVIEEATKTPTPPSASATDPRAGSSSSFSSASSDASSPPPPLGGKPVSQFFCHAFTAKIVCNSLL